MNVSLEQVRASPGRRLRVQVSEPVDSGAADVLFTSAVAGEVELRAEGHRLRLVGRLGVAAELVCSRCLAHFRTELEAAVDEWLDPHLSPAEEVLVEEGVLVMPLAESEVDLTEVARQHLLLAVPLAPRCRPDCAGLCPVCGADRNTHPCQCGTQSADPRWQVLQNVLGGLP